ncbi:lysozyme inhibitor LprI family protein [Kosakonia sp. H02]|nr:lysozyme inhibitor LprI family protein [Kosakonia sp. H02]
MKTITLIASLLFFGNSAFAATKSITENKDVSHCAKVYGESDDECLGDLNEKSEKELNDSFNNKLKEITSHDYTRWWRGTQEQKDRMLATYKQNQKEWIQYRNGYCELVSTQAMGTHAFGEDMLGCILNMNKLRIEQINMIKP